MKRKLWTLLLALVLAVCVVPTMASAAEVLGSGSCGENAFWKLTDDGVLTISGSGEMSDYSNPWFKAGDVREIVIEEGITYIGRHCFVQRVGLYNGYLSHVEKITIPASVTSMDEDAFGWLPIITFVHYGGTKEAFKNIGGEIWANDGWPGGYETFFIHYGGTADQHYPVHTGWEKTFTIGQGWKTKIVFECSFCNVELSLDYFMPSELEKVTHEEVSLEDGYPGNCVTPGRTSAIYCSGCDRIIIESEEIPAKGYHDPVETRAGYAATCTESGLKDYKYCIGCSTVIVPQETIPALGHEYMDGSCSRCGQAAAIRLAGTNRISTALTTANKLKEVLGVEKFQTIVVANAMNFPDALSGSYLAAAAKAPILLYADGQSTVTDYIKTNLAEGGTVYILGGESSVPESIVTALPGIYCERVSGSGRWATSLAIIAKADEILGTKPEKVLICDGSGFADSLSASATGLPILLVNGKGTLREDQKAYLESVRGAELYAIGGVNTITPDLLKELDAYDANGTERVYGSGRELTSAAVAKKFFPEAKTAALASSLNFPDGLSGGPVAYAMNMPLLLTREGKESVAKDYVNSAGITSGYIIGGTSAVSDESGTAIFGK